MRAGELLKYGVGAGGTLELLKDTAFLLAEI